MVSKELLEKVVRVSVSPANVTHIEREIGIVFGEAKFTPSSNPLIAFQEARESALLSLRTNALDMGANAVFDLKFTTSSFEAMGSKWQCCIISFYGNAVVLDD